MRGLKDHLEFLVENNYAKNINIRFDTNLSVVNPKLFELFKHFKKIVKG